MPRTRAYVRCATTRPYRVITIILLSLYYSPTYRLLRLYTDLYFVHGFIRKGEKKSRHKRILYAPGYRLRDIYVLLAIKIFVEYVVNIIEAATGRVDFVDSTMVGR